jgi:hypothetical protein
MIIDIDIKTAIIVLVVLFVIWNFVLCDGNASNEKFDLHERNKYTSGDYSSLEIPTHMINNDTKDVLLSDDYKFPAKKFVMIKQPYKISECARRKRELDLVINAPVERNLGEWTHRGPHVPRNTGYSPRYHDKKTVQYIPSWPSVADDWETVQEIPKNALAYEGDYPVLETSDKVDMDKLLY